MKINIFDIETAPNPDAVELYTKPFDRESVKVGNIKDPDKIKVKLDQAESDHWAKAHDKAALNPFTAKIVAIGIHFDGDDSATILEGVEASILNQFWDVCRLKDPSTYWAFYSGSNDKSAFDPRHIIARSWVNKVTIPFGAVSLKGYISNLFIDLAPIFMAGASYPTFTSADMAARQLGLIGSNVGFAVIKSSEEIETKHGITGKTFHQFLGSTAASEYLTNDLAVERGIANTIITK